MKRRITEHLAVLSLNPSTPGPILCLVGPPGVWANTTSISRDRSPEDE